MDIDIYISELLFENDLVNVPGLGSFSAKKLPAQVDEEKNQLSPPSKRITFEPKVKGFDEKLINFVAQKEKISTQDASKKVKDFVKTCKEAVIEGKVVVLNNLGKLSMNDKGDYIFKQDPNINFNKSAFGMKPFSNAAYKKQDTKKIIKQEAKKQSKQKTKKKDSVKEKKKNYTPIIIWASIAAILIAAGVLGYLNQELTKKYFYKVKVMIAGEEEMHVPDSPKGALDHVYMNMVLNDTITKDAIYMHPFIDTTLVTRQFAYTGGPFYAKAPFMSMNAPLIIHEQEDTQGDNVDNSEANKDQNLSSKHYHVIAGSFEIYNNAVNYCETLKNQGYPNSRVFKKPYNGLHRVTYNSYSTKETALDELKRFRSQINPNSWVLIQ